MSSGVVVRRVHDTDGESLIGAWDDTRTYYSSLDEEFFRAPDPQSPLDGAEFAASLQRTDDDPTRFARLAELDDQVVGFIIVRLDEPVANAGQELIRDLGEKRGYVEALVVHRNSWRRGVGRALMAAAEAWARDQGATVMTTDTSYRSPVSVPFYESLGYARQAIIFRKSL